MVGELRVWLWLVAILLADLMLWVGGLRYIYQRWPL